MATAAPREGSDPAPYCLLLQAAPCRVEGPARAAVDSCSTAALGCEGDRDATLLAAARLFCGFLPGPPAESGTYRLAWGTGGSGTGLPRWRLNL